NLLEQVPASQGLKLDGNARRSGQMGLLEQVPASQGLKRIRD
ncbi:MAG: hypothetical protein RLZZ628_1566, partial [Bacteroidota bacterium]